MGKKYISVFVLAAAFSFNAAAQSVIKVIPKSGSAAGYVLSENGSISFSNGDIVVNDGNGSVSSFDISRTNKLLVDSNIPMAVEDNIIDNVQEYNVYPNPTTGILNISGDVTGKQVFVYNLTGSLQMQIVVNSSSIDLASLPSGIYLVKIESKTFRIIKR